MNEIQQLIVRDTSSALGIRNIFPKSWTEAITDKKTREALDEILDRFNFIHLPYAGSAEATRLQLDIRYRRRALWVSYIDDSDSLVVEYYNNDTLNDSDWSNSDYWVPYNTARYQPNSIGLDSLAPEVLEYIEGKIPTEFYQLNVEDLVENSAHQISFANRDWSNGKGYIIIRKGDITQDLFLNENTNYIIRYDHSLNNQNIEIPNNSSLIFEGGSFSNGTITFTDTTLLGDYSFNNVVFYGSLLNKYLILNRFGLDIGDVDAGLSINNILDLLKGMASIPQLYISNGYYDIQTPILLNIPNLDFIGADQTYLVHKGTRAVINIDANDIKVSNLNIQSASRQEQSLFVVYSGHTNITCKDIMFQSDSTTIRNISINSDLVSFYNLYISGGYSGIELNSVNQVNIFNSHIKSTKIGMVLKNIHHCDIERIQFESIEDNDISVVSSTYNNFSNIKGVSPIVEQGSYNKWENINNPSVFTIEGKMNTVNNCRLSGVSLTANSQYNTLSNIEICENSGGLKNDITDNGRYNEKYQIYGSSKYKVTSQYIEKDIIATSYNLVGTQNIYFGHNEINTFIPFKTNSAIGISLEAEDVLKIYKKFSSNYLYYSVKINNVWVEEVLSTHRFPIYKGTAYFETPVEGALYYNSTQHTLNVYNGTDWISFSRVDELEEVQNSLTDSLISLSESVETKMSEVDADLENLANQISDIVTDIDQLNRDLLEYQQTTEENILTAIEPFSTLVPQLDADLTTLQRETFESIEYLQDRINQTADLIADLYPIINVYDSLDTNRLDPIFKPFITYSNCGIGVDFEKSSADSVTSGSFRIYSADNNDPYLYMAKKLATQGWLLDIPISTHRTPIRGGSSNFRIPNPSLGCLHFNSDSGCLEVFDGTYWKAVATESGVLTKEMEEYILLLMKVLKIHWNEEQTDNENTEEDNETSNQEGSSTESTQEVIEEESTEGSTPGQEEGIEGLDPNGPRIVSLESLVNFWTTKAISTKGLDDTTESETTGGLDIELLWEELSSGLEDDSKKINIERLDLIALSEWVRSLGIASEESDPRFNNWITTVYNPWIESFNTWVGELDSWKESVEDSIRTFNSWFTFHADTNSLESNYGFWTSKYISTKGIDTTALSIVSEPLVQTMIDETLEGKNYVTVDTLTTTLQPYATQDWVNEQIANINTGGSSSSNFDLWLENTFNVWSANVDNSLNSLSSAVSTNTNNIATLTSSLTLINNNISSIIDSLNSLTYLKDLFDKEAHNSTYRIKAKYGLYSNNWISTKGVDSSTAITAGLDEEDVYALIEEYLAENPISITFTESDPIFTAWKNSAYTNTVNNLQAQITANVDRLDTIEGTLGDIQDELVRLDDRLEELESMFTKVTETINGTSYTYIRANYGLYSNNFISTKGVDVNSTYTFQVLEFSDINNNIADDLNTVFNAYTIQQLYNKVNTITYNNTLTTGGQIKIGSLVTAEGSNIDVYIPQFANVDTSIYALKEDLDEYASRIIDLSEALENINEYIDPLKSAITVTESTVTINRPVTVNGNVTSIT